MASVISLQLNSRVRRAPDVIFSQLDDEWLAIDSEAGYCYSLNTTAGEIWKRIGEPISIQSVCDELCRQYAVEAATCQREVLQVVQQMAELEVVSVVAGEA